MKEAPHSPPPKRRGWIDALVATALRWNDRLSRPIGAATPVSSAPGAARIGAAAAKVPALPGAEHE